MQDLNWLWTFLQLKVRTNISVFAALSQFMLLSEEFALQWWMCGFFSGSFQEQLRNHLRIIQWGGEAVCTQNLSSHTWGLQLDLDSLSDILYRNISFSYCHILKSHIRLMLVSLLSVIFVLGSFDFSWEPRIYPDLFFCLSFFFLFFGRYHNI